MRIVSNLCSVATPLVGNSKQLKIEDFFDPTIKATVINGKTFDDNNDFETDTHYGKKIFAHKVVRPKADSTNFSGFQPLLTNLALTIKAHIAAQVPSP